MNMIYIETNSTDPYFNIAAEEYLLKNSTEDIFLLYVNQPSVIVGKHQNVYKEVNYPYVYKRGIDVVRRLSGGGAVYHDGGNLNFTFITNEQQGKMIDFKRYLCPIQDALKSLGVFTNINERNNLLIGEKKISGNAEHILKTRVLHHGTLLLNTNLEELEQAIKPRTKTFIDKSIMSVRSFVTNIGDYLEKRMVMEDFKAYVIKHFLTKGAIRVQHELSKEEVGAINELVQTKYGLWDWNFGYSPKFEMNFVFDTGEIEGKAILKTEKATIMSYSLIHSNDKEKANNMFQLLIGEKMEYKSLLKKLSSVMGHACAERFVLQLL